MIDLKPVMTYRLEVSGPLTSTDGSEPDAHRQYWLMTKATLEGNSIKATTPMPGIDWFTPQSPGVGRPHVRIPFQTDDGALVLMEYRGIVHATEAFSRAVENDAATRWEDQYMRMALMFETTSIKYAWLVQHLFLARGRLLAAKTLEYEVYCVE